MIWEQGNKSLSLQSQRRGSTFRLYPYPTAYPQPGWQEQAPEDWWQAIIRSTRHLLDKTKIDKMK